MTTFFSNMTSDLNRNIFQKPLDDLAVRWINFVKALTVTNKILVEELTNSTFHLLAKSLQDLIVDISDRTDHKAEFLLISNNDGWHPNKKIVWKSKNSFSKCLEQEYFLFFELLKKFDLGYNSFGICSKPYIEMFKKRHHYFKLRQLMKYSEPILGDREKKLSEISDEKCIWFSIMLEALFRALSAEYNFDCFDTILQGYVKFVIETRSVGMEMFRVITHSTIRFIRQTMTYMTQKDCSQIDHQILQKQFNIMNAQLIQSSLITNDFQSVVKEFSIYWEYREDIITVIPNKIHLPKMKSLKQALLEIVSVALDKTVPTEVLKSFFVSYNNFLRVLDEVEFDWYVKAIPGVSMETLEDSNLIKVINNKWVETSRKTYRVIAVEKFTKAVSVSLESSSYPKHYTIEVVLQLLSYVKIQLTRTQWKSGGKLSETEQIDTSRKLLDAVRTCCLKLKKQPDYGLFELFLNERIEPFTNAINNSNYHADFSNQIFWTKNPYSKFIRTQNEINIDDALKLFETLNSSSEIAVLRSAYQKYDETFHQLLEDYHDGQKDFFAVSEAFQVVKKVFDMKFQKPFNSWTNYDKREQIPELLAGLAVVWTVKSQVVSGTEKLFTPRSTQILYVLRLLSVNQPSAGVENHFTPIIGEEEKSLVLAMTAILLALTGHKPRIVCSNNDLASTIMKNFQYFFSLFSVENSIIYGTKHRFAYEIFKSTKLVNLTKMWLAKKKTREHKLFLKNSRNSVLLIDGVDCFVSAFCRLILTFFLIIIVGIAIGIWCRNS
ncbi:uncharacterized protein LOC129717465 [Wyeomyia smithii]|uniref:uncharacterized protein LOC129717465 n=1 Tax=Wyeomyia smithii TaxID=174621 RepID=UPI0024680631|nr:uncharacterized protein LOC129717465 [Wyeomyia smithii]XP_055523349.1 uncharacterized protein LOC129717465 [Wyeomyia smithii]